MDLYFQWMDLDGQRVVWDVPRMDLDILRMDLGVPWMDLDVPRMDLDVQWIDWGGGKLGLQQIELDMHWMLPQLIGWDKTWMNLG